MSAVLNSNGSTPSLDVSPFRKAQMERIERNIAKSFLERPQWVLWRLETREGEDKPTKMPYQVNGRRAKSDTPQTWATFAAVVNAYVADGAKDEPSFSGVGYMCNGDETIVDLDHCFDDAGKLKPQAQLIVDGLKSYTEISQSGHGLHIWATPAIFEIDAEKGYRKGRKNADTNVEMYCERRFVAMTGNHLDGTPESVEARESALRNVLTTFIDEPRSKKLAAKQKQSTRAMAETAEIISLDDKLMLARLKKLDGAAHTWLTQGYGKKRIDERLMSETDYGVVKALIKCGAPDDQIIRIMRGSALMRDKFDRHPTYLVDSVRNARAEVGADRYVFDDEEQTVETASAWDVINSLNLSDRGNAIILGELIKDKTRAVYVSAEKLWYTYTDETMHDDARLGLWVGNNNRALRLIDDVVRVLEGKLEIVKNAIDEADDEGIQKTLKSYAKEIAQWIKTCQSGSHPARMLEHAEAGVTVANTIFNADPYILSCANGLLDLRTRTLRECTASDYITMRIKTAYNPQARSAEWGKFIAEIFNEDENLIGYVQRAVGYSLVGKIVDNVAFILYGQGGNGKTVLTDALAGVLDGDVESTNGYAASLNERVLMSSRNDGGDTPSPALIGLRNKRFVRAREAKSGDAFDTAKVKMLASPENIAVRPHGGYYYEFAPTHKLWLSTNIMPKVVETDDGIWDRLKIIRFPNRYRNTPNEKKNLRGFFSHPEQREAILLWMIEGARLWIDEGETLCEPETITASTEWLRNESDDFAAFADEYLVLDGKSFIPNGYLMDTYSDFWMKFYSPLRRDRPKKSTIIEGFKRLKLEESKNRVGEVAGKGASSVRGWRGARFKTVAEHEELHPVYSGDDVEQVRAMLAKLNADMALGLADE